VVLAEAAVKIAAGGGDRKGTAAGIEMVEGFFLDRILCTATALP